MSEFLCEMCNKYYEKFNNDKWNTFKDSQEYLKNFPEAKNHGTAIVCTYCYEKFMIWFDKLSSKEKQKMLDECKKTR